MRLTELNKVNHGTVEELEDVLRITKVPAQPNAPDMKIIQNHIRSLERSIKQANQTAKYSDDKELADAFNDLVGEVDVIISDLDDLQKSVEEYQSFTSAAVDAISDWKSFAEDRLDDSEREEWTIAQVKNKLVKANSK